MLNEIQSNFEKLIALYESERDRASSLESELEKSRAAEESLRKQIAELSDRISHLELKGAFTPEAGNSNAGAREKIDALIREIDKCISLLEKE